MYEYTFSFKALWCDENGTESGTFYNVYICKSLTRCKKWQEERRGKRIKIWKKRKGMLNLGRGQEEEKREEMRIAVNDKCDMIGYILKEKKLSK